MGGLGVHARSMHAAAGDAVSGELSRAWFGGEVGRWWSGLWVCRGRCMRCMRPGRPGMGWRGRPLGEVFGWM